MEPQYSNYVDGGFERDFHIKIKKNKERYIDFSGEIYLMGLERGEADENDVIETSEGIEKIVSKFPVADGVSTGFRTSSGNSHLDLDIIDYGRKVE